MNSRSRPAKDGVPIEGRFAELSSLHLSTDTAMWLDLWASSFGNEAPVLVAANVKGWFVATLPVGSASSMGCPDDLSRALRFGRFRGFDYLFFHCDAPLIADLPQLAW